MSSDSVLNAFVNRRMSSLASVGRDGHIVSGFKSACGTFSFCPYRGISFSRELLRGIDLFANIAAAEAWPFVLQGVLHLLSVGGRDASERAAN